MAHQLIMIYDKDFLIAAFMSRYVCLSEEKFDALHELASNFYDTVSKDKFRQYASLDAAAIKKYRLDFDC